jgi:hypothetical protein
MEENPLARAGLQRSTFLTCWLPSSVNKGGSTSEAELARTGEDMSLRLSLPGVKAPRYTTRTR